MDDSDEELIEKLASRRKEKLAQEKSVERDFARTEGFVNKVVYLVGCGEWGVVGAV